MLTTDKILDAAEEVLRKYGPRKITVVDVARSLDVSHGTVYRHFATKVDLHEAITSRWLQRVSQPLLAISTKKSNPKARLREWFEALMKLKHDLVINEVEMFESYSALAQTMPEEKKAIHINAMLKMIQAILEDGKEAGEFEFEESEVTARCLFFATVRYHHPLHAPEWTHEHIYEDFDQLFKLLERAIHKA